MKLNKILKKLVLFNTFKEITKKHLIYMNKFLFKIKVTMMHFLEWQFAKKI
jgi:hypothetical protein